jgi:outer membrane protein assembly factor BamB
MRTSLLLLPLLVACQTSEGGPAINPFDALAGALTPTPNPVPHESATMSHRGAAFAEVSGLEMASKDAAWAGMGDMTCRLMTISGTVVTDVDTQPFSDETVTDVSDDGMVITLTDDYVGLLGPTGDDQGGLYIPGVRDARTTDDGDIVTVSEDPDRGCLVNTGIENGSLVSVPGMACEGSEHVAVDRDDGDVYVGTNEGVVKVDPEGKTEVLVNGDLVAWGRADGMLFTADTGSNQVRGHEADGTLLWTSKVGGTVTQLETVDGHSGVFALVDLDGRGAQLWWLHAVSGDPEQHLLVRTPVDRLAVSPDGSAIGIASRGQVDFFDVDVLLGE